MLESAYQDWLRRLALGDEVVVTRVVSGDCTDLLHLEDKAAVLVKLACSVAAGSDGPSLFAAIDRCHAAGVEIEEIVETVQGENLFLDR